MSDAFDESLSPKDILQKISIVPGYPLYYYRKGQNIEVDFVIEDGKGNPIPLEFKSSTHTASRSLDYLLRTHGDLKMGIWISEKQIGQNGNLLFLPLYLLPFLKEIIK